MQPQPASTTRKNICTNTDNYFKLLLDKFSSDAFCISTLDIPQRIGWQKSD